MGICDWSSDVCSSDLLDRAAARRHENELRVFEGLDRQHRVDLLAGLQWQHVVERLAARATRARRQFEHAQLVALAEAGEAQQRVVRVCDPEAIDKVLFLGGRRNLAATTALLRLRSEEHTSELQSLMRI